MEEFKLNTEYIQLNQLLKVLGWVEHGGDANAMIDQGYVKVNDQVELRRRNKIYPQMIVEFDGNKIKII